MLLKGSLRICESETARIERSKIVSCCLSFFAVSAMRGSFLKKMDNLTSETFCIERANIIPPLLHLTAWYNVGSSADTEVSKIDNPLSSLAPLRQGIG